ncbi:hypothetical protein A3F37_00340 [Candidatus Saccharibacteria bacterium RIFCSPHIGHO2_12_FULL_41_12]|nr:MAG: hypothetical protein A3F37_00340 [Candidatus Saccharibacteria bacterium RIFCSPHIGHO2_12_FULL_41_12]
MRGRHKHFFIRNTRATRLQEIFFVSAITSLLLTRFYLAQTGFPQLGSGNLHIAHMLWGGLIMFISITISLAFLGYRTQRLAALVGGIGFGIFIDELGKFITESNDYFFRPTVGLLYAIFAIIFIIFTHMSRKEHFTNEEYQINAIYRLEESIIKHLDKNEKNNILQLLSKANQNSKFTSTLKEITNSLDIDHHPDEPGKIKKLFMNFDDLYEKFWLNRNSGYLIRSVFALQIILIAILNVYSLYNNLNDISSLLTSEITYDKVLIIAQIFTSLVSMIIVIIGIFKLGSSRLEAFKLFKLAILITLFLTEFFLFLRLEFSALPNFGFNLLLLGMISYVIDKEEQLEVEDTSDIK